MGRVKDYYIDLEEELYSIVDIEQALCAESFSEYLHNVISQGGEALRMLMDKDTHGVNSVISAIWNDFWMEYMS